MRNVAKGAAPLAGMIVVLFRFGGVCWWGEEEERSEVVMQGESQPET